MTNEDISYLTNSISNLSLNKNITESENSDNETANISNPTKLIQNPFTIILTDNQLNEALVLRRAGKSTGRNRIWLNIKKNKKWLSPDC